LGVGGDGEDRGDREDREDGLIHPSALCLLPSSFILYPFFHPSSFILHP
jgi:hypothetical protein